MLFLNFRFCLFLAFYKNTLANANDANVWFDRMNEELGRWNNIASNITWRSLLNIGTYGGREAGDMRTIWRNQKCDEATKLSNLSYTQARMIYILCRGPKYTVHQSNIYLDNTYELISIYTDTKVCRYKNKCYSVEPDLAILMAESRDQAELLWAWITWREAVGPPSLQKYPTVIHIQNLAAQNNGYNDIGECWREELETPNLEQVVENLYKEISHFHKLLHAFVRYKLSLYYGETNVPLLEPIPAHLLGNMWSQSWESLTDITIPEIDINMDERLQKIIRNSEQMVKQSEKFYTSMGFPRMTPKFWAYSKINRQTQGNETCHGTAADLFDKDDYRMLVCAQVKWEDFYTVTHEMGHIEYFMSYKDIPTVFKDAANSAMGEAIGDAIMLALESPKNLKRLGIISNITQDERFSLLMKQALKAIPRLPFGLVVDKWRWNVMSNIIPSNKYNQMWWDYRWKYEGIQPPIPRGKYDFDPAAKYHIADNTPYIRYFLSTFLEFQIFDVLCEGQNEYLNQCDLYGVKSAGTKLRKLMEKGSSKPWNEIFHEFSSGKYKTYSSRPILNYFSPLISWLEKTIEENNIPIGW